MESYTTQRDCYAITGSKRGGGTAIMLAVACTQRALNVRPITYMDTRTVLSIKQGDADGDDQKNFLHETLRGIS